MLGGPRLLFRVRGEGPGCGSWGGGSQPPPHQLGAVGSAVNKLSQWDPEWDTAAKRWPLLKLVGG